MIHFPPPAAARPSVSSDVRGISTVEYVVILVLVGLVAVSLWRVFGQSVLCGLEKGNASMKQVTEDGATAGGSSDCPNTGSGSGSDPGQTRRGGG